MIKLGMIMPSGRADHCFPVALGNTSRGTGVHHRALRAFPGCSLSVSATPVYVEAASVSVVVASWSDDNVATGCSVAGSDVETVSTQPR